MPDNGQRVLLDVGCGHWGWSRAFAARGWKCIGIDLFQKPKPEEFRENYQFIYMNIMSLTPEWIKEQRIDFACASTPCEEFSVHGMKHFHPNPPYPKIGLKLFNHCRQTFDASGILYVMENVRAAQQFVGESVHNCGPFHLWGNAVPPLMHRGIIKNYGMSRDRIMKERTSKAARKKIAADTAVIPPELSACVAEYATRLMESMSCEARK